MFDSERAISTPSKPQKWPISVALLLLWLVASAWANAQSPIAVDDLENGEKRTGQSQVWHDPQNNQTLASALQAYASGQFQPLLSAGSSGLKPGAIWSHFSLHNTTAKALTLHLEYVDHQLTALEAFGKSQTGSRYEPIVSLSMRQPFDSRPVRHNRFVIPVHLDPGQTREFLVKFGSNEAGFTFPSLRIWTPANLSKINALETNAMAFLFGGFLLMSLFALISAIATGEKAFYAYSAYAMTKIISWGTILGYTHQFLIRDQFHWNYMSISGALAIICGLLFARIFLQSRRYTPKLDYLLLFMLANAGVLMLAAVFELKLLALISITLALLLYPAVSLVGLVRWRQGSTAAAIFALAWGVLVVGLVVQALRDLGFVQHNFLNYYWPPVASFTEMLAIIAAMGMKVRKLQHQKQHAEQRYLQHLERSKAELELQVLARTQELEQAKLLAEQEARTDPLTNISNRRHFLLESEKCLKRARRKHQPLSLLMFDIDHFKTINDTHGHDIGDKTLCLFAQTILNGIRETDVFGRLGGEEFGLLLNEEKAAVLHTAERLLADIAQLQLKTETSTVKITASVGIVHDEAGAPLEQLLKLADKALYQAKAQGRNCCVEYVR